MTLTDQHSSYDAQLDAKLKRFQTALSELTDTAIETYRSPPGGYRMRAEFRIWHDKPSADNAGSKLAESPRCFYAMYDSNKQIYEVSDFPAASGRIQSAMPVLLTALQSNHRLKHKLFRVEFLSTASDELLITLVYHKALEETWHSEAQALRNWLTESLGICVHLIGRAKKQKWVLGQDFVTEHLEVAGQCYRMQQIEGSFTQPNAEVNSKMVVWACKQGRDLLSDSTGQDLLELYCGNGNFTLPLAGIFNKVLATEISKASIRALNWNIDNNGITNIQYARLSAEEMRQAMNGERPFRRLADIPLAEYQCDTLFVDPPRAGIDRETLDWMQQFKNIIYISCNPVTLVDNLKHLSGSHRISAAAAFDQFPFTPHLETGVVLRAI